jgi:D-alanyl-D-alanine carboxypeptidase
MTRPPVRSADRAPADRSIIRLLAAGLLLALAAWPGQAAAQIGSDRYASFVVDAGSGTVLSSVNADEPRHPASLAKLMTLYMLFEALRDHRVSLQQAVPVSAYAASMPPSKLGITPGMYMTVEDALLGLVTKSANDAAAAIAEMLGGDEDRFAAMMTLRARGLGMQRTVFRNASGLPDPDMWSTARDLAILARRILTDFPNYYGYFSTPSYEFRGHTVWNHDRMLQTYPGADGMKTGYTEASGHNLVTSASRGGVRLIGVVLGAASNPERDLHMAGLLDQGFEKLDVPTERRPQMASRFALLSSAQAAPATPQASVASPVLRPADRAADRPAIDAPRGRAAARWTIQVGSFATQAQARAAARAAEDDADAGDARVEPVTVRGKTVWRAQVAGLPQQAAQGACAQLARRRAACTVIRPDPGQLASR